MAYSPVEWNTGDVITAAKLNNMDNGIINNEEEINNLTNKTESIGEVITQTSGSVQLTADTEYHPVYSIDITKGTYIIIVTAVISASNTTQSGMRIDITGASSAANRVTYCPPSPSVYVTLRTIFPLEISDSANISANVYAGHTSESVPVICNISAVRIK